MTIKAGKELRYPKREQKKGPRKELQSFYDRLIKERDRIVQGLTAGFSEIATSELPDWVDLASASHERELSIILNGNNEDTLDRIDEALRLIEEGTFGICQECKKSINKERLTVVPFARFCVSCQEKREKTG
ncbi:MAG: TraR/DksA family transcriptional regulator [bacterium]|nr:TraR/DksA family transcriptional regulator [bacterium]